MVKTKYKWLKKKGPGAPLDPTENTQAIFGDTYGEIGITTNKKQETSDDASFKDVKLVPNQRSSAYQKIASNKARGNNIPEENKPSQKNQKNKNPDNPVPPNVAGEQSVSGTTPNPSSDDDTLANEHAVGLKQDEDIEHPKELDIASDIDKAEEYHRQH